MENVKIYLDKKAVMMDSNELYRVNFNLGNGEIIDKWSNDSHEVFMTCKQNDKYYAFMSDCDARYWYGKKITKEECKKITEKYIINLFI